jgi:hypothetical protein
LKNNFNIPQDTVNCLKYLESIYSSTICRARTARIVGSIFLRRHCEIFMRFDKRSFRFGSQLWLIFLLIFFYLFRIKWWR